MITSPLSPAIAPSPHAAAGGGRPSRAAAGRRQRGVSLVELMIGLAIGLFLTMGLLVMLTGTSQGYRSQDEFARMQEGGAEAMRYLGDSIRMAGFYGLTSLQGTQVELPMPAPGGGEEVDTLNDCGSATNPPTVNWALPMDVDTTPIRGANGLTTATVNAAFPCILAANFVNGPILVTRGANGITVRDSGATPGDLTDALFNIDAMYVQSNPALGPMLFRGGAARFTTLKGSGQGRQLTDSINPPVDAPIYEYSAHVYYIRPCSRPVAPPACAATDDDGRPVPTLVRQQLAGRTMGEVPLVQGVERLGFLYGIDANGDGSPETQTTAPTALQWANVVTVRVAILMRSITPRAGFNDDGNRYDLTAGNTPPFTCNAAVPFECQYLRHVFAQTFIVRNIAGRRGAL
jgi:type IV pilus assembly protein PilW